MRVRSAARVAMGVRRERTASLLVALLLLAACGLWSCSASSTAPELEVRYSLARGADSVPLRLGQRTRVGDLPLTLVSVLSDSRCPRDVLCVWLGDAVVRIQADPPCLLQGCLAPSALLELHTDGEPREAEYFGYRIRLLALEPEPLAGARIDPRSYVAWVRVTR